MSLHTFEDDLPELANIDDLTAGMAAIMCAEAEEFLAKRAAFHAWLVAHGHTP